MFGTSGFSVGLDLLQSHSTRGLQYPAAEQEIDRDRVKALSWFLHQVSVYLFDWRQYNPRYLTKFSNSKSGLLNLLGQRVNVTILLQ